MLSLGGRESWRVQVSGDDAMTVSDFGLVSMEFKPCKWEFEHVCSVRVEDNR